MLKGKYYHNMDAKGRVFIPAKFRSIIGETFVVTYGLDNCLWAYSTEDWAEKAKQLSALPMKARNMQQFFFSNADDAVVDKQGRILLSADLRKHALLEKETAILGVGSRMEIWNADRQRERFAGISMEQVEAMMEEMNF